jgi:hypothetical protein
MARTAVELALAEVARAQSKLPAVGLGEDPGDPLREARQVPEADGLVGADVYADDLSLQDLEPESL